MWSSMDQDCKDPWFPIHLSNYEQKYRAEHWNEVRYVLENNPENLWRWDNDANAEPVAEKKIVSPPQKRNLNNQRRANRFWGRMWDGNETLASGNNTQRKNQRKGRNPRKMGAYPQTPARIGLSPNRYSSLVEGRKYLLSFPNHIYDIVAWISMAERRDVCRMI